MTPQVPKDSSNRTTEDQQRTPQAAARGWPIYYGWVNVLAAAILVSATLPGRTHGLGLITQPLLEDLALSGVAYGWINFAAVVLGAALGLGLGRLVDRLGSRAALTLMTVAFGLTTLWTAGVRDPYSLLVVLALARGLAQVGLTAGAAALVGKWFRKRLGYAMSAYSILMGAGFVVGISLVGFAVPRFGWRETWTGLGLLILGAIAPLVALCLRSTPRADEPELELPAAPKGTRLPSFDDDVTLLAALFAPTFWIYTLAYSMFALSFTAITLFNELILAERGFGRDTFLLIMILLPVGGAIAQAGVGWLLHRWGLGVVMAAGLWCLAVSMASFPFLRQNWQVVLYAIGLGVSGSLIMVSHMAFYPRAFGRVHLGQIQAAAQVLAVVISAMGPVLLAYCRQYSGSYALMFFGAAAVMLILGLLAWAVPLPGQRGQGGQGEGPD